MRLLVALGANPRLTNEDGSTALMPIITGINEHSVTLRVADQVKLEFERSAIGRIVEGQGDKDA